jgi:mannosyltransferase
MESPKLNWRGEKPKPSHNNVFRRRWRVLSPSKICLVIIIVIFALTSISLYSLTFGLRNAFEHDPNRAKKVYQEYLASPEHQALIYPAETDRARGKAALIALVRNKELDQMTQSMRELEETFNRKFKYPWIFFNDVPFTDKFKRITSSLTDAETFYGTL